MAITESSAGPCPPCGIVAGVSTVLLPEHVDVAVVGAGIVGLAHAWEAHRRGASVLVVDAAARPHGASVRNFGHACTTPQTSAAAVFADEARRRWIELGAQAGFAVHETGTHVVARRDEESAVLAEFAATRDDVTLLGRDAFADRVPVAPGAVQGGAFLPADLQVDPRRAVDAIIEHLATLGVRFAWRTAATGAATGVLSTTRGAVGAATIVVATNHDLDRLFPRIAEAHGLVRCRLHMLRATPALRAPLTTPLLTGWSLLRYSGFTAMPSADALRSRLGADLPEGIELDLNQMVTQHNDGSLILGDTHERDVDADPFASERGYELVLRETARLFGVREVPVVERWQGVYASAPGREFVVEEPEPGVHVVTVASGIGMTTGLGIAPFTFDGTAARIAAGTTTTGTADADAATPHRRQQETR
jgi:FAD dependent oxidoreductase TIGR03364